MASMSHLYDRIHHPHHPFRFIYRGGEVSTAFFTVAQTPYSPPSPPLMSDLRFQLGVLSNMDSHGKSTRDIHGKQKKRRDESEPESETDSYTSDTDGSYDLSPPRSSRGRKGISSRIAQVMIPVSDDGRKSKKRTSSKKPRAKKSLHTISLGI